MISDKKSFCEITLQALVKIFTEIDKLQPLSFRKVILVKFDFGGQRSYFEQGPWPAISLLSILLNSIYIAGYEERTRVWKMDK